ncbi:MAG TPA: SDR family oxidoreductase [Pseudolabrys sp.]|nr:SDR family oxidoreductase [Pseudolabrys sp.]HVY19768.1 SDR family oxidoreductase [Bauldia sp.]
MQAPERPPILEVRGLRVLVTGGGSGIGLAIAEKMIAAGSRVHIVDVDAAHLAHALKSVTGLTGSVGDASEVGSADKVVDDLKAQFGGLDVLVNNVGVAGPTGAVDSYTDEAVDRTIAINLNSQFYFLRRCVPLIKASRQPSILAISSVAGRLGYAYRTPYAATKWAIVGLIKSLAIELGPAGIRVNAILPGVVSGERMDRVIADRADALGVGVEETRASYLAKISLRRMVDAEDVANLALFLTSDLARNITGQAISVDGNVEYL